MSSCNNVHLITLKYNNRIESLRHFVRIYQSGNLVEFNYLHVPTLLHYIIISRLYKSNRTVLLTDSLINIFYSILLLLLIIEYLNIYYLLIIQEFYRNIFNAIIISYLEFDTYFWKIYAYLIIFEEKFSQ